MVSNLHTDISLFFLEFLNETMPEDKSDEKDKVEETKTKPKPCCACKETRSKRDECILENGEEKCSELIEAHKKCMRDLGFKI